MPCAGALECGGQNWNDGRVGLRRRQGELKIIGGRVPNRAWAPILVFDFNQVKTFHAVRDAPTALNYQAQRWPPETPGPLQESLTNYLNRPTAQRGGGSLQRPD